MKLATYTAAVLLFVGLTSATNAATVTYDIEFDTPVFSPIFSDVNTAISSFGPTITGTLSIDPSKVFGTGANFDTYLRRNGGFSLDLEWDTAFDSTTVGLLTLAGTTVPENTYFYQLGGVTLDFFFPAGVNGAEFNAFEFDPVSGLFSRQETVGISNFTLTERVAPVPLPAGLPLLLAGLGALAVMRKRNAG